MPSPPEEFHLLPILSKFDGFMANSYLHKLQAFKHVTSSLDFPSLVWEHDDAGQPLFFRAEFDNPLYFVLSHPLSRFSALKDYRIRRGDFTLCLKLAFVPAFCLTLNTFTVIKPWSKGATDLFSPTSDFLTEENTYWELPSVSKGLRPQYSSMNFVLKQSSEPRLAPTHYGEIMDMYFKYLFWSFPKPGFSCCPHMIHGHEYVSTLFKMGKSVYAVGETFEKDIAIGFNRWRGSVVRLTGLTKQDGQFRIATTDAVLTVDISEELDKYKGEDYFINGIVSEFRRQSSYFHTITAVAELGYADIDLVKSVIGIVVADRFLSGHSLASIGTTDEIRREVEEILSIVWQAGRLTTHTVANGLKNLFERAFLDLAPVILEDEGKVLLLHPYLFSCLTEFDLFGRLQRIEKGLIYVLRLLEKIRRSPANYRNMPETKYLKEHNFPVELVERALLLSIKGINFSRMIKRFF